MAKEPTRDLQCPVCGYVVVHDLGIGATACGPHVNRRGEATPATPMRVIRDWPEVERGETVPISRGTHTTEPA
mgnify:CR=1 FL=1